MLYINVRLHSVGVKHLSRDDADKAATEDRTHILIIDPENPDNTRLERVEQPWTQEQADKAEVKYGLWSSRRGDGRFVTGKPFVGTGQVVTGKIRAEAVQNWVREFAKE